jgi:rhamnose utilization protein RhaD (predicted bifunctional aldolase and dehydrogenase)
MWIKASGFELRNAELQDIFTLVDSAEIARRVAAHSADPLAGCWTVGCAKPSIETTLHALMPHAVVLHTHSIATIAAACRTDVVPRLNELFADLAYVFVPYAKPGVELARGVMRALESHPQADIVVLGNHGIVVGGPTPELTAQKLLAANERLKVTPRKARTPKLTELAALAQSHGLVVPADEAIHSLALDDTNIAIATAGSLYPDHVVFLGSGAGRLDERAELLRLPNARNPKLWLEPGVGVLVEAGLPPAALAMARCLADTVAALPSTGSCKYLTVEQEAELLGMEEEKHRQRLARQVATH